MQHIILIVSLSINTDHMMNQATAFQILAPFYALWTNFVEIVPRVVGALLILLFGWVIAVLVANIVRKILVLSHIDTAVRKTGLSAQLERIGLGVRFADLLSWSVKWFILLFVFIAAADVLQWTQVSVLLNQVIIYIPRVVVAALILLGALYISQYVYDILQRVGSNLGGGLSGRILAQVARSGILVIAVMMALIELGIAVTFIHIAFGGLVVMLAVAGGIAFGVGGIDKARELINQIKVPKASSGSSTDSPPANNLP